MFSLFCACRFVFSRFLLFNCACLVSYCVVLFYCCVVLCLGEG